MRWLSENGRWRALTLLLAAGWVLGYLVAAELTGEAGFPLDDAWIHQTYARNLASSGRWEYVPGQLSSGSTAPLWTFLLAIGYWLRVPYFWWAWGLGILSLALVGWTAHGLTERLFPPAEARWLAPVVGILCVSEWHLVWAAASGMETVLFVALSLALMERVSHSLLAGSKAAREWIGVGFLSGLLVLTRPEGVLLVGLTGLAGGWLLVRRAWSLQEAWRAALMAAGVSLLMLVPYLLFNFALSGRLWPNTYYAKQTEYAAQLAAPFLTRLARVSLPPLVGFQVLLVPGLILGLVRSWGKAAGVSLARVQRLNVLRVLPLAYGGCHLALYALRLPVVYQHGRYLIPAIPPLILSGVWGLGRWLRPRHSRFTQRVASQSWMAAVGALLLVFLVLGARAFGEDVQFIQGEMVAVARWLGEQSELDELVAAHDIGAIGYFAGRPILDLAGLISPDVAPLLGKEEELADYVLASEARYLVTAPGWRYGELTGRPDVTLLYSTGLEWTVEQGMNNSSVYRLPIRESR